MRQIDGNEPAFPTGDGDGALGIAPHSNGMTLRQYYAGQAMNGLLANECNNYHANRKTEVYHAERAVKIADALLAELEKKPTK